MVGYPEETESSIKNTKDLIERTHPGWFKCNIITPYAGSELYSSLLKRGEIKDFWKTITESCLPVETPNICANFSKEELRKIRREINLLPYLRKKTNLKNYHKMNSFDDTVSSLKWIYQILMNR